MLRPESRSDNNLLRRFYRSAAAFSAALPHRTHSKLPGNTNLCAASAVFESRRFASGSRAILGGSIPRQSDFR